MGESLEAAYIAVERSYGEGRFAVALQQALALLPQLEAGRSDQLDLRLQLLIGHIHGHGLQQPAAAAAAYSLVLERSTDPTLQALAGQGLELCAAQGTQPAGPAEAPPELPATPWLSQLAEPEQALQQIRTAWSSATPGRPRSTAARVSAAATGEGLEPETREVAAAEEPEQALAKPESSAGANREASFSPEDWTDHARGWLLVDLSSQPRARR